MLGRREPRLDDTQPLHLRTGLDRASDDLAFLPDDIDELARLVGDDRFVRHQHRAVMAGAQQPRATEQARRQEAIGIGDDGVRADRPRIGVDRIVDEFHLAVPAKALLVGELDFDRVGGVARRAALAGLRLAQILEIEALGPFEREPDRIGRDDSRQDGGGLGRIIAHADAPVGHDPGDRRPDGREAQVELRRRHIGTRGAQVCLRGADRGELGLIFLARDRFGLEQHVGAGEFGLRVGHRRLRLGDLRTRLRQRGLIGARIDREESFALLHALAVVEEDSLDRSRNARTQFDVLDRLEPAYVFIPIGDVALQRYSDTDLRHRRRRRCLLRTGSKQPQRGRAEYRAQDAHI